MWNHAREGYFASETLARLDVRRIDARGGEFDAHFTRSGTRCLNFADLQYFACGAVALIVSGLHWPDPLDRHDSMMRPSANRAKNRKSVARYPLSPIIGGVAARTTMPTAALIGASFGRYCRIPLRIENDDGTQINHRAIASALHVGMWHASATRQIATTYRIFTSAGVPAPFGTGTLGETVPFITDDIPVHHRSLQARGVSGRHRIVGIVEVSPAYGEYYT